VRPIRFTALSEICSGWTTNSLLRRGSSAFSGEGRIRTGESAPPRCRRDRARPPDPRLLGDSSSHNSWPGSVDATRPEFPPPARASITRSSHRPDAGLISITDTPPRLHTTKTDDESYDHDPWRRYEAPPICARIPPLCPLSQRSKLPTARLGLPRSNKARPFRRRLDLLDVRRDRQCARGSAAADWRPKVVRPASPKEVGRPERATRPSG
jgi:hypothetical protein